MIENALTLSALNKLIKQTISDSFKQTVWLTAEISDLQENRNGHAYLELVEKAVESDQIIAKSKAMIWANVYRLIKPYFETSTGYKFTSGLKVMVNAFVEFHEIYGFSLNIRDIDPVYTVGDLQLRRNAIIKKLEAEGVLHMNRELELSIVIQRIAVITSPTAAGYEDFVHQLKHNPSNYKFYIQLFPAIMQGEKSEESIIKALDEIFPKSNQFDIVVIIRGGGAKSELACFDSYWLAYNITQFPIPVITGIGHEKDFSIVDIVAHTSKKTPTAVAEFLINGLRNFESEINSLLMSCIQLSQSAIEEEKENLRQFGEQIKALTLETINDANKTINLLEQKSLFVSKRIIHKQTLSIALLARELERIAKKNVERNQTTLNNYQVQLKHTIKEIFIKNYHKLQIFEKSAQVFDSERILQQGYSITLKNGQIVRNSNQLQNSDVIETILQSGKIKSTINQILT